MKVKLLKDYPLVTWNDKYNVINAGSYLSQSPEANLLYVTDKGKEFHVDTILANPDWFAIEYEVGDYVKRIKAGWDELKIGDIKIVVALNQSGAPIFERKPQYEQAYDPNYFIPATQSEIDQYKKEHEAKFPYEYKSDYDFFRVFKSNGTSDNSVFIRRACETGGIHLDKESFLEIGKRMGWT